jgi:5-hydroxyisourate hydrolase
MTSLGTHVLDTMHGRPAAGLKVTLSGPDGEIARGTTNGDGRCPSWRRRARSGALHAPLRRGDYFRGLGVACPIRPSSTK